MSSDDLVHLARPDQGSAHERARLGKKFEALCGATTPKDGGFACGPPNTVTCWKCILLQCGRPVPTYPPTPEHERLKAAKSGRDQTQLVGEFLEWLGQQGIRLARYSDQDDELYETHERRNKLLADFFEINENALESEKQALLDYMSDINAASEWAKTEGRRILRGT